MDAIKINQHLQWTELENNIMLEYKWDDTHSFEFISRQMINISSANNFNNQFHCRVHTLMSEIIHSNCQSRKILTIPNYMSEAITSIWSPLFTFTCT